MFIIIPRLEIPDYLLLDEEEENFKGKKGEIFIKFRDFKDVFNLIQVVVLPYYQYFNYLIPLMENIIPLYSNLYILLKIKLKILQKFLEENLARGWIKPSESPAVSPVIFIPKKDRSLRLCVDYQGLNKITVKNRYPLPLISEIFDRASNTQCFSKIDLKDAYY